MMALALQDPPARPIPRAIRPAARSGLPGRQTGNDDGMSKDELIIQLVKIGIGILIGGYFLWWSLEVLHRLPPH